MYDYDVVVVGGGPAGLAAATRVRWVKGYHALPGSVCVVESGPVGGLLSWGSCILTGPGWAYRGQDLTATLLQDIERFEIPIVEARVDAVRRSDVGFEVCLRGGRGLRCLAVVLATGFRPLANEAEYYLRGVRITFKGYDHFPALVAQCVDDAGGRGLVVVGNRKTSHLAALLDGLDATLVTHEELVSVRGDDRVEAVVTSERTIPCGAVLMDYNGFELEPTFDIDELGLERDDRGFVLADRWLETSESGVFAAGDITGRYASTIMALGDGVCAGFSAYRYCFERKFGEPPKLFAYAATDAPVPPAPKDVPTPPLTSVPVALSRDAPAWIDGRTLEALAEDHPLERLMAELEQAIAGRHATVHHLASRVHCRP